MRASGAVTPLRSPVAVPVAPSVAATVPKNGVVSSAPFVPGKPVVVGLTAAAAAERDMTADEARAAFSAAGFPCFEELDDAVAELKRLTGAVA